MAKFLYTILAGTICALIVHIFLLFIIPAKHHEDAWLYLQEKIPLFQFGIISQDDHINGFNDPFFITAACPFHLTSSPVHFRSKGEPIFWSMSIYSNDGVNLYSANSNTAPQGQLNYMLGTPEQIQELNVGLEKNLTLNPVSLSQDIEEGFMMLRVFIPDASWQERADDFLKNARCELSPLVYDIP